MLSPLGANFLKYPAKMPLDGLHIILDRALVAGKVQHVKRIVVIRPSSVNNSAYLEIIKDFSQPVESVGVVGGHRKG